MLDRSARPQSNDGSECKCASVPTATALPRVSALSREKGNRGAGADAKPVAPEVPVLEILTEELGDGLKQAQALMKP